METSISSLEAFREAVALGLARKVVLAVTSEPNVGSLFHLGVWVRRSRPINNPALRDELKEFEGSDSLYVRCPWELDSPTDLRPPDVPLWGQSARMGLLEALVDTSIQAVEFPSVDLVMLLRFANGMTLALHPEQAGFGAGGYTVGLGSRFWISDSKSQAAWWDRSAKS